MDYLEYNISFAFGGNKRSRHPERTQCENLVRTTSVYKGKRGLMATVKGHFRSTKVKVRDSENLKTPYLKNISFELSHLC